MEDASGVEFVSLNPYLTDILIVDEPAGALAGLATAAATILAVLTF